ncbi:hypothetical protein Sango_2439300 [Sesamum angolense]|uniref:Retrotransposon Copia-like N-terminal domain-containing protein n=1 Tax=Sesamum angolense TaxID=2727404 RepID=A0AAE1W7T1_9LAMI|nr:hypothetical protein Sango_2439300 [Sesamum angolense]
MNGMNHLSWSRAVKLALHARMKLCFIGRSFEKPGKNDANYEKWIRTNSMVQTWILNSISKDIVDAFLYTKTSRELWKELEERYGECNGPLLYPLQREIAFVSQGSLSVAVYFTKLKMVWDELACLTPLQISTYGLCVCGFEKSSADLNALNQLMQFLMGLNDSCDN